MSINISPEPMWKMIELVGHIIIMENNVEWNSLGRWNATDTIENDTSRRIHSRRRNYRIFMSFICRQYISNEMCKQSILCANRIFYALFNYSFCSKFTMIRCIQFLHCELWMFQLIYTLNAFISYSFRNSIYLHAIYLLLYKFFLYTILVDVLFVVTLEIFFLFFFFHYVIWFFTCYITSNQLTFSFVHLSIFVSRFFLLLLL